MSTSIQPPAAERCPAKPIVVLTGQTDETPGRRYGRKDGSNPVQESGLNGLAGFILSDSCRADV